MLLCCGCVNLTNNQITTHEQFNNTMMNYFRQKDTTKLPLIVDFVSRNNIYTGSGKAPLYGFFAGIQHENPKSFNELERMKLSESARKMLKTAKEYKIIAEDMLAINNYYLESPASLDAFWGYFFATGDDRVIKKMCQTAQQSDNYTVKSAAEWSLNANRKKYPEIKSCSAYK